MDRVECESPPWTETSFSVRGLRVSVLWSGGESAETLYEGDGALSAKPVMLIWAPLIPATRWSCSQQTLLSAWGGGGGGEATSAPPSSWDKGYPDKHNIGYVLDKLCVSVCYRSRDEQYPIKKSVKFTLQPPSWMCRCHI